MNKDKKMTKKERTDVIVEFVKNDLKYHVKKDDLRYILRVLFDIELKKSATNEELVKTIIENCKNRKTYYIKIYEMLKHEYFGMNLSYVEELFEINRYKRKQLEEYGLLDVAYTYQVRAYRKYLDVPVYNLNSVFDLLGEDLDMLIKAKKMQKG